MSSTFSQDKEPATKGREGAFIENAQCVVALPLNWVSLNPSKVVFQDFVANVTHSIQTEISKIRALLLVHVSRKFK